MCKFWAMVTFKRNNMKHHQRFEEDYEVDDYDEYAAEASGSDGEDEQDVPMPSKEEQEFLKLREQLKDKIRWEIKKQISTDFGHLSQTQDCKRAITNDKFGTFFGPSQPVIASRVLEESRSVRETQHIVAKDLNSSSYKISLSSVTKTDGHNQRGEGAKVKNKAQVLKDMRDYSFLFSDDADLPTPASDPAPRKVASSGNANLHVRVKDHPVIRKVPVPNSVQPPLNNKNPTSKPSRIISSSREKNASSGQYKQAKVCSMKEAPVGRPKPASVECRKAAGGGSANGLDRSSGEKALPPKVSAQVKGVVKPPTKVTNVSSMNKKALLAKPHSSAHKHLLEQQRATQGSDKVKLTSKQVLASSKLQPSKQIKPNGGHEDRPKKRPARMAFDDDDDGDDAIGMIRKIFRYNPNKYAGIDAQDDRDMEVGFDSILKEERRSAKIAKEEDDEQLRLIEEEEKQERMRTKQKKLGQRN